MKKTALIPIMALLLTLIQVSAVWAARHPYPKYLEERWFTVEEDENPYLEGLVSSDDDYQFWKGQYYYNDQTFFSFRYDELHTNDVKDISGSYLWDNGFFLGASYVDSEEVEYGFWGIYPGYRWNINHGYVTIGLDLLKSSPAHRQTSNGINQNHPITEKPYIVVQGTRSFILTKT